MTDLLNSALEYIRLGYSVFPIKARDKVPASNHGFKDATTDEEQIRFWWELNPNYNIGIATGAASGGLVVIDLDRHNEKADGYESFRNWSAQQPLGHIEGTATVHTGSDGYHLFYHSDKTFRNGTNILSGVDVRADGGYIVAPPSIHPNGTPYEWDEGMNLYTSGVAELPDEIAQLITKKDPFKTVISDNQGFNIPETVQEGSRNDNLFREACKFLNSGMPEYACLAAIWEVNVHTCNPPLSQQEVQHLVHSAYSRGYIPTKTDLPVAQVLPQLIDISDSWASPKPLKPELIHGILRRGHKLILTAPSKAGKTVSSIELAYSVATGHDWLGVPVEKGKVMYINMEVDDASIENRIRRCCDAYNQRPDHDSFLVLHMVGILVQNVHEFVDQLIETYSDQGYSMIIIDPIYKLIDGDENSNSDVGRMVTEFDRLKLAFNASIVYAHHYAKGDYASKSITDRGAGAGAFSRDADAIVSMVELDAEDPDNPKRTAWRYEFVLREFENHDPISAWLDFPIHTVDPSLDSAPVKTALTPVNKERQARSQELTDTEAFLIQDAFENLGSGCTFNELYEFYENAGGVRKKETLRKRLKDYHVSAVSKREGKSNVMRVYYNVK